MPLSRISNPSLSANSQKVYVTSGPSGNYYQQVVNTTSAIYATAHVSGNTLVAIGQDPKGGKTAANGTTAAYSPLHVFGHASVDTSGGTEKWVLKVKDTTEMTAGVGGGILFQGNKTSNGYASSPYATGNYGGIAGRKINSNEADELGSLYFYTVPSSTLLTERMRIHANGNVGIGIAGSYFDTELPGRNGPQAGLHVLTNGAIIAGGTPVLANATPVVGGISMGFDGDFNAGQIAAVNPSSSQLWFYTKSGSGSAPSRRMVIDAAGKLGLSTAPSSYYFDSAQTDYNTGYTWKNNYDKYVFQKTYAGTAGTKTITIDVNTVNLRHGTVTVDISNNYYTNGGDQGAIRYVWCVMQEATNLRRNERLTGLEFSLGNVRSTPGTFAIVDSSTMRVTITMTAYYDFQLRVVYEGATAAGLAVSVA